MFSICVDKAYNHSKPSTDAKDFPSINAEEVGQHVGARLENDLGLLLSKFLDKRNHCFLNYAFWNRRVWSQLCFLCLNRQPRDVDGASVQHNCKHVTKVLICIRCINDKITDELNYILLYISNVLVFDFSFSNKRAKREMIASRSSLLQLNIQSTFF